jgi:ABC-type oligopeptide transport system substrate-binding subunit
MKTRTLLAATAAAACLSACTTIGSVTPSGETVSQSGVVLPPRTETLEASKETLIGAAGAAATGLISPSVRSSIAKGSSSGTGLAAAVASALLYVIYDPLAPNWTIKEQALDEQTYHFTLRAKNFRVGGDGEAMRVVERRARQLQREKGYTGYRLLDYSEGIESATPFTYRVSEGTIQLVKTP